MADFIPDKKNIDRPETNFFEGKNAASNHSGPEAPASVDGERRSIG